MPLVPCPDCGREISDTAPACVHCGRPMAPARAPVEVPPRASGRPHPLAGRSASAELAPRAVLRGIAIAAVIGLVVVRWIHGGRSEGLDALLSALIPLVLGASLLLMPSPEQTPARTAGTRRRVDWGAWFNEQDARRDFQWNVVIGWMLVVTGAALLLFLLAA